MKGTKEVFIGEIRNHLSNASTPTKTIRHSKRLFKRISPLGLVLIAVAITGAMLIGSLYSVFTVKMTGDIELGGSVTPLFSWDGLPFESAYHNVTGDITSLQPGDDISINHQIANQDAGAWSITFDLSKVLFTDPLDPFFGFYFSTENYMVNGEPSTGPFFIVPGDTASFDYRYRLDAEMVAPADPLPFNVGATLERIDSYPAGVNDSVTVAGYGTVIVDVLANDLDVPLGLPLHIVSVTSDAYATATIIMEGGIQKIQIHEVYGGNIDHTLIYTISDRIHSQERTIFVHAAW